jgi:serine/threonine-protein kinase Chk1
MVRFNKAKGDPIGWRRLFKSIAVLCREAVVKPDVGGQ